MRSYVKRFNEVKIKVIHYDESMVAMVFCKGLLFDSKLYHSLVKTRLRLWQKYLDKLIST